MADSGKSGGLPRGEPSAIEGARRPRRGGEAPPYPVAAGFLFLLSLNASRS